MATVVYILCALASALCTVMLGRAYFRSQLRFLMWSALCFVGFTINNLLVTVDMLIVPEMDLSVVRVMPAFAGIAVLIFGLIWDAV